MKIYKFNKKVTMSQEDLKEFLNYDPETGIFFWKEKDSKWFKQTRGRTSEHLAKLWNSQNAGNEAFTSDNGQGYLTGAIDSKPIKAHRVAWFYMTGEWPNQIDHANGIRSDNRFCNLFNKDKIGNARNQKLHKTNTSGYSGVHKRDIKSGKPYQARIYIDGKRVSLGYGATPEEAYELRLAKERELGYHELHGTKKLVEY